MAEVMAPPPMPQPQQHPTEQDFPANFTPEQDLKQPMAPPSSTTPIPPAANGVPRRPARKSTLTQQQRNHKRQRATQDQLMTLEVEFNSNPTPTAVVRERIAEEINMTERSVQIWFQNRRAKIKNIAKKTIESGEDLDQIPESMRHYLAMQQFGPNKGMAVSMMARPGGAYMPYGPGMMPMNPDASTGKSIIQHFACRSLAIGSWRRVGKSTMDLVIFYSPDKACITYYILNNDAGYKIEYPFAWIKNITLDQGDAPSAAEGASQHPGGLNIELTRPPRFYMDSSGQNGFYECGDFTEDQQATRELRHHLGGPAKVLSGQLAKLVSLEAYLNRHTYFDATSFAVSAPVSPLGIPRPASQPNNVVHPQHGVHLLPHDHVPGLMGPPGPRGHKRQRSRSVPAAIDFSMLRHPMPSFLIQHEGQPPQQIQHDPNIWAPVPQHQHSAPFSMAQSVGPNLSIDTTAGYQGFPFGGPMSATSAPTPSDFGTPAFFTPASGDTLHPGSFGPGVPFAPGFLTAVDPAAMIGTSNTPLSMASSNHDPVIADHSPPLNGLGRSQSTDIFGTPGDAAQFGDDSLFLSESFNKQIALPFRSPYTDDAFHSPMPDGAFHFEPPASASGSETQMHTGGTMTFNSPPPQGVDGSISLQSPQSQHPQSAVHQDSAISFSTPSHLSPDATLYHSPKDQNNMSSSIIYQDSKLYSSPGQISALPSGTIGVEHGMPGTNAFAPSPLAHNTPGEELDLQSFGIFPPNGTIDPTSLRQGPH